MSGKGIGHPHEGFAYHLHGAEEEKGQKEVSHGSHRGGESDEEEKGFGRTRPLQESTLS